MYATFVVYYTTFVVIYHYICSILYYICSILYYICGFLRIPYNVSIGVKKPVFTFLPDTYRKNRTVWYFSKANDTMLSPIENEVFD